MAFALAAAVLAIVTADADASTVANTNDSGPGSLRAAINAAAPGEVIVVPAGTYTLTSGELAIEKSLTIAGAGPATTILRAGANSRVLHVSGNTTAATITGVTIRDGLVEEPGGIAEGGGVFDEHASLTLEDDVVTHNRASADGEPGKSGGVARGGGIAEVSGSLSLVNTTVSENTVSADGGSGGGGGVAKGGGVSSDALTLASVSFTGNKADARGGQGVPSKEQAGGVAKGGAIYTVPNGPAPTSFGVVTASENVADASAGPGETAGGVAKGGGLFIETGVPTSIAGLTATANLVLAAGGTSGTAAGGIAKGGAAYLTTEEATLSIVNATVAGNAARASSGGIAQGGGLWTAGEEQPLTLTSATLDANAVEGSGASSGGGDLYSEEHTQVRDTIVNAGAGPAGVENCAGGVESLGNNLDSRDECTFHKPGDLVNANPLLGPLHENGGALETEAISPGSPALDAGSASGCPSTDARGVARPQGLACDIGAFELAPPAVATSPASAVGSTAATVAGSATNPDVLAGTVYFQYGPSNAYGLKTIPGPLAAGATGFAFSTALAGLTPGTLYHYRAVAVNPDGTSFGLDRTFTTTPVAKAPPPMAPELSGLAVRPSSLRAEPGKGASLGVTRKGRGATIVYSDSAAALTTLTVQSVRQVFRVGKRCQAKAPRHHKGRLRRCPRYVTLGSFTHADSGGSVKLHFTGRVNHRPLPRGSYRLLAVARGAAGKSSRAVTSGFSVIR